MDWEPRFERTPQQVEAHAREVWATITRRPNIIRILAESMPRRIEAVIAANGGSTKY